jgi:RNA polymerase sigma-70 factor (ECF subfamily)
VGAVRELVQRNQAIAFRAAYVVTGSAADAEEVAQDALVKSLASLRRLRPGSPFRPWLLRIVANEAKNRLRSGRRREAAGLRAANAFVPGGAAPSPEAELDRALERDELLRAVAALPAGERQVVACRYLAQLTEEETAALLDVPAGTVKSRLSRGLARLREQLGDDDG